MGFSIYNIWDYGDCKPEVRNQKGNTCPFDDLKPSLAEQFKISNWPKFELGDRPDGAARSVFGEGGLMEKIPQDPNIRADITPNLGAQTKNWPIYSDVSLVNTYNFQSSLIHPMWGYMQGVFYSKVDLFNEPVLINEVGKYFGIDYLFINPGLDPIGKFEKAGWVLHDKGEEPYRF